MGKAREDLRSNWRSANLAVAEKLQNRTATLVEWKILPERIATVI
jgi:hypothetical protein